MSDWKPVWLPLSPRVGPDSARGRPLRLASREQLIYVARRDRMNLSISVRRISSKFTPAPLPSFLIIYSLYIRLLLPLFHLSIQIALVPTLSFIRSLLHIPQRQDTNEGPILYDHRTALAASSTERRLARTGTTVDDEAPRQPEYLRSNR